MPSASDPEEYIYDLQVYMPALLVILITTYIFCYVLEDFAY